MILMPYKARAATIVIVAVSSVLCGCAPEEEVVHYKPFFTGVQGAEHGIQPVTPPAHRDPSDQSTSQIVIEHPDGSRTLVSRSIQHLIKHLQRELAASDERVLYEQLISQKTKDHYVDQGKKPEESVTDLMNQRRDVLAMLKRLPLGERTPQAILKTHPDHVWQLRLTGLAKEGLELTELWAVREDGNWRLLWVR